MDTIKINSSGVKMIAHRGLSGIERENTCPAFVAAGNRSYFGIETDVHVTKDGKFVIIHDETVKRVSSGEYDINVEESNYSDIEKIVLPDLDNTTYRKDIRIPLLKEYISICKKYEKICVLEIKNHFEIEDIEKLINEIKELKYVKDVVCKTADEVIAAAGSDLKYQVGTMIEIPRAALTADKIAGEAEFFSFGTNDLTQMTYGFSRDDAGKFLDYYYEKKIFESDPFAKLDQEGVGSLVKLAAKLGRETRPDLKLGICGEHGGDPSTVEFCHSVGLNYVSCSPFRVPIARLAAAQAAIKDNK